MSLIDFIAYTFFLWQTSKFTHPDCLRLKCYFLVNTEVYMMRVEVKRIWGIWTPDVCSLLERKWSAFPSLTHREYISCKTQLNWKRCVGVQDWSLAYFTNEPFSTPFDIIPYFWTDFYRSETMTAEPDYSIESEAPRWH